MFANIEYVYIKEANFYASPMFQKQHIYPSIKQSREAFLWVDVHTEINSYTNIVLYHISKRFLWERDQNIRSRENKFLKMWDRLVLYKLY